MNTRQRILHRVLAAATMAALAGSAFADEAEIFTGRSNIVSAQRPNILFIMDTSGSMNTNVVTQVPFDPDDDYPGNCQDDRVYFQQGSNSSNPPACSNSTSVPRVAFRCDAALSAMADVGYYIADRAAQWRGSGPRWRNIQSNTGNSVWVECRADAGVHGDGVNTTRLWAADAGNGPWTANSAQQIGWNANGADRAYVFYSGNYINWLRNASTVTQTRLEIMQDVAKRTIDQLAIADNVNLGLMRFSNNAFLSCSNTASAEGGMVLREVASVAANADVMKDDIDALNASGCTPLSETMYEAYRYLSGIGVHYGNTTRASPVVPQPSVLSSREPAPNVDQYKSPLQTSCQKNFIVLLTDGIPTSDTSADGPIQGLMGGSCAGTGSGRCLEEIAQYMYENDLRPSLPGLQNATTYTIGFGPEVSGSAQLRNTAAAGGGVFYEADDTATLSTVLTNIVRTILDFNTSFTAPAVSVNAFNRTQNLNDLYVTVFKPSETYAWPGNVKKYRLGQDGVIRDQAGLPAVEASTGFFRTTAHSFWSPGVDGDSVRRGGAGNLQPDPASRRLFSDLTALQPLTGLLNEVTVTNALITPLTLGLTPLEAAKRDKMINWLRGMDVDDEDGDGVDTDPRLQMGDPMNGRPATVIYGGTAANPDPTDGVLFSVTNDGYLHAINAVDGTELWSFIPQQLMRRTNDLYTNDVFTDRVYGLDGNIRTLKIDHNQNGVVEPLLNDRVAIFFGMRRGGSDYFALDVTNRDTPVLLWKIGPNELGSKRLPNAGQSWSTPSLARVNVGGATQNAQKQVLVFGGGYDTVQDNVPYVTDTVGNQIFMVDALSGDRLWYAGPSTDLTANRRLASMTHGFPGDIRVFDITGDGLADRMYAADMGGRVWRFDIHNGQPPASLVTGGVFASLGNAHLSTHPQETTRRFYSAPDVAFLTSGGRTWLNLALGSGYRGHPLDLGTQDRFYSLRDYRPFARLTQDQFDAWTVITEADATLVDITDNIAPSFPAGTVGWRLDLRRPSGPWSGEKSLTEARTVQNMIQFSTFEPNPLSTEVSTSCTPGRGTNRLYTISAFTGAPVLDRENPSDPPDSPDDRDTELAQGGIAPEVVWLFPSPDNPNCEGAECRPPPQCLVGLENCGVGINLAPVRTFWRQSGVN